MQAKQTHKDYNEYIERWEMVDDVVRSRLKRSDRRKRYLPKPNPDDTSRRNDLAYDNYVKRAHYYNFTKPTLAVAIGSMFAKKPEIELDSSIEYMIDNVDGSGLSMTQQIKKTGEMLEKTGRAGLMVDWTDTEGGRTRGEEQQIQARPVVLLYNARSILDWKTSVFRNRKVLSMVKLKEDIDPKDGEGQWHRERVLSLENDTGLYIVNVYYFKDDNHMPEWDEEYTPKAQGNRINYIPFYFVGASDNDENIDDAPLYDLASINVSHFQSSADFEDFRYKLGQVQPVITGVTTDTIEKNGGKLAFGSGVAWVFGEGANAMLLQANPNTASFDSMKHKEEQARAIGAKLLEVGGRDKTATEAMILLGSDTATIETIVDNIEDAYRSAFMAVSDFSGAGEADINLSRDFATAHLAPEELRVLMDGVFKGIIPDTIMFDRMRKAGHVEEGMTNEELREQIDNAGLGLGLNNGTERTTG